LTVLLTISPTLGRQFQTLIDISTILTLVMYGWCAAALLRVAGAAASSSVRLALRACAILALAFSVWTVAVSEPKLILVSAVFMAVTVPLWIGVRLAERTKAAAAAPETPPLA